MRNALRAAIVVVVAAVVAVTAVVVGNAAQLQVQGGQLSVAAASAHCTGTATATPQNPHGAQKYDDVRITLPAGCGGRVQVVVSAGATALRTYDGTVAAGGSLVITQVDNGGYRPSDVTVTAALDGWNLPTAWGAAPPPATRCEVIDATGALVAGQICALAFTADLNGDPAAWQVRVTVSTTSATAVRWRAVIDFADTTKFPFVATKVGEYTTGFLTSPVTCSTPSRSVTFTGRSDWGYHVVSSSQPRVIDLNGVTSGTAGGAVVYSCG